MRLMTTLAALLACSAATADEYLLELDTDLKAEYYVVAKAGTPEQPTLLLKRVRGGATSYSKRLFDCAGRSYRELGSGEELDGVAAAESDDELIPVRENSIADQLLRHACSAPATPEDPPQAAPGT
jgi:hypothetical protein